MRTRLMALLSALVLVGLAGCSDDDDGAQCDNGQVEDGELCDGNDLGGNDCSTIGQGFTGGNLTCNSTCDGWVTTQCTNCGDGVVDGNEVCDGTDLDGEDCASIGTTYVGGTLACATDCLSFDIGGCWTEGGTLSGHVLIVGNMCDASDVDNDCKGFMNVAVLAEDPYDNPDQTALNHVIILDADVSGGASEMYTVTPLPPGTWWVTGFIDDDDNRDPLAPAPDLGDLIIVPQEITITANQTTEVDLPIYMRMPDM